MGKEWVRGNHVHGHPVRLATAVHDLSLRLDPSNDDSPYPYGLYILNRTGTGDYNRRVYPEDEMEELGQYVIYRQFPDYTNKRLSMGLPYPLPPQFRPSFDEEFAHDNSPVALAAIARGAAIRDPFKEKKGTSVTLGFWMFTTEVREPLRDVMFR